jgi:hypothetical protein
MNHDPFGSVKTVGGLLPSDLLGRILAGDPEVPAAEPEGYGLQRGESVRRQASRSWDYVIGVARPGSSSVYRPRRRWLLRLDCGSSSPLRVAATRESPEP